MKLKRKEENKMYKQEIKEEYKNIYLSLKRMDEEFVKIKTAIHTLEKLGFNVDKLYEQIDNTGIEIYNLKQVINKSFKEER